MCSTHIVSLKKKSQLQISILICENLGKCFPLSDSQAIYQMGSTIVPPL